MEGNHLLKTLILKFVDGHPSVKNMYKIERFFAKSSECFNSMSVTRELINEGFLSIVDQPNKLVTHFQISGKGRLFLAEHYSQVEMANYADTIEPSGFYSNMLRVIDGNENQPGSL